MSKEERICSHRLIDMLFTGGSSKAVTAFPLRAVYRVVRTDEALMGARVQMMVSVPKKHFKHAVKRNRVKRQVREAYRKNKMAVAEKVAGDAMLLMAFIWLDDKLHETVEVESRVKNLLERISERI